MEVVLIALLSAVGFVVAYHTYGRWLGRRIFGLSADAVCPSESERDGTDYVPTAKSVVFGHHFTSIAGTGPIVGPAIAILWGWLPALLWVVFGSIFIGAVHDFGALVVSLRHRGRTVGEIAGTVLNRRVRLLFLIVLFLALTIVLAIFGLVIAAVFRQFPASIFPCLFQIPLAVVIGVLLHRAGRGILVPSLVALGLMYLSVYFGDWGPLHAFNAALASLPLIVWVALLLAYSYAASILPVWALLQPRDYINSLQLVSALGLIVLGLAGAAVFGGPAGADGSRQPLELVAPAVQWSPESAPAIFPFLFITVACGAISGFHCLVSSGTSSKQLRSECDATFVGFGGMLTEGFLATLVILACAAGIGLGLRTAGGDVLYGEEAWLHVYASWKAASGLAAKVGAFVSGAANFLGAIGIPRPEAVALMGVLVASFAATTLDTACRLQRYVVQELARTFRKLPESPAARGAGMNPLVAFAASRHGATAIAVASAFAIAAFPAPGKGWNLETSGTGGLILWPMFGATNQLLAGLAFLVIFFFLRRQGKPVWFLVLPMVFMLVVPLWAMLAQIFAGTGQAGSWISRGEWHLVAIGLATVGLELWMLAEAAVLLPKPERSSDSQ